VPPGAERSPRVARGRRSRAGAPAESSCREIAILGRVLPRSGRDPAQAAGLLEETVDRILRSESGPVLCLEAPEPAEVPHALLRTDGRSVHRRHGGVQIRLQGQRP
jgi:hypothetical protein